MTDSESRFAAMPARQKASVVIFFIVGAFILWEAIGIFRGSGGGSTTIAPATPAATSPAAGPSLSSQAPSGGVNKGPTPNNLPSAPPGHGSVTASSLVSKPVVDVAPPPNTSFLVQQDQSQNHYVAAINDLQMLKIQREIAETSQAIVAAKLATVTAEKSISDLLSPGLMDQTLGDKKKLTSPPPPPPPSPMEMTSGGGAYSVQSVTMELDQWHAVIGYNGKLYEVMVGDTLPTDGSLVSAIDPKGVTLELHDIKQRIPLTSTDSPTGDLLPGASTLPGVPGSDSTRISSPPPPAAGRS